MPLTAKNSRTTPTARTDRLGGISKAKFIKRNAMGVVMQTSLAPVEWKPEESSGNRVVSQREIRTFGVVGEPHRLPAEVVTRCTFSGALNECVRHDGRPDRLICEDLCISPGYMSKFLRSVGESWAHRMVRFMRSTNCIAPLQKLADEIGCDVVVRSSQAALIAALEAQLSAAKRAA